MKQLSHATRDALSNFGAMLLVNLSYEGIHKLREIGQSVTGLWIDSVAIAALFTLFMFVWRMPRSSEGREGN